MLRQYAQQEVRVKDGLFKRRMEANRRYLRELDDTCLLQNYYLEAGIIIPGLQVVEDPSKVNMHWGWEAPTCQLRGHFLGHYMSASASLIANGGDPVLESKLSHIVSELHRCQTLNGGEWAGPIPEKYFEVLTTDRYIWSPQYTIHKLLMGLLDTYKYTENDEALEILSGMADWFIRWIKDVKTRKPEAVFNGEQAGMLELWADAYGVTGDERYKQLADEYKDQGIFKLIRSGIDALTDNHSNASIPIIQGAAKLYELTNDADWRSIVEAFWESAVTKRGMYATTGANAGEFWIPPMKLGQYRGDRNQEFCTVYNMVRVAQYLLKWTGDPTYSDYIERCIYNAYLAQQNRDTGMPTYFLPLTTGSRKKWASKRNDFWCCQGTMIQAETLYPSMIYSADDEGKRIYINQFIPSVLTGKLGDFELVIDQSLNMMGYEVQALFDEFGSCEKDRGRFRFNIELPEAQEFTISIRAPKWLSAAPQVMVDSQTAGVEVKDGYINITRVWKKDTIDLFLPSELRAERLPDMPEIAAFVDGPIVLAGLTENVDALHGDFDKPLEILNPVTEHTYDTFLWQQNTYMTRRQHSNFRLIPLYDVQDESYTVYFEELK